MIPFFLAWALAEITVIFPLDCKCIASSSRLATFKMEIPIPDRSPSRLYPLFKSYVPDFNVIFSIHEQGPVPHVTRYYPTILALG